MTNIQKRLTLIVFFIAVSIFKINAQTVYITETGKKYHAKNCRLAKSGKKGIPLKEAKKLGYKACKFCKADKIKAIEEKKTKEAEGPKS